MVELYQNKSQKNQIDQVMSGNFILPRDKSIAHSSTQFFISVPQNRCSKNIRKFPGKATHVSVI